MNEVTKPLRNIYLSHEWRTKLFSEEKKVPRSQFEIRKAAESVKNNEDLFVLVKMSPTKLQIAPLNKPQQQAHKDFYQAQIKATLTLGTNLTLSWGQRSAAPAGNWAKFGK